MALKTTRKKEAIEKAGEISAAIESGTWSPESSGRSGKGTFAEIGAEFVDHVQRSGEWAPSTAEGYAKLLRRLLPAFGDRMLANIVPRDIEGYLTRRIDRDGIAPTTRNRELAFLKSLYKKAIEWGYCLRSPAATVRMLPEVQKSVKALTEVELETLLTHVKERGGLLFDICLASAETGLRMGSLRDIRWCDVDWDECFGEHCTDCPGTGCAGSSGPLWKYISPSNMLLLTEMKEMRSPHLLTLTRSKISRILICPALRVVPWLMTVTTLPLMLATAGLEET